MNGRQFSSNFLGESFQSKYLEASFHCIVRSYKIELSSIVQQTSSEFVVYESFTPILRTNEASKRVWIEQGMLRAPFTELPPLKEKPVEQAERFVSALWRSLLLLFWEAPSAAGAFVHFLLGGNF